MPIITVDRYMLALRKTPVLFNALLHDVAQQQAQQLTDGPGGWSVVETMCHISDLEPIQVQRATLILEQELPTFPNFDPTVESKKRNYKQAILADEFAVYLASRKKLVVLLEGLNEQQWQRKGIHSSYGEMSLLELAVHITWHDLNHVEQIARTLQKSPALV